MFIVLSALFTFRRRPDLLLALGIVSIGFGNFWVYALGTIWFPVKIVGLGSLFYVSLLSHGWLRRLSGAPRDVLALLLVWVILACFLAYALPLPPGAKGTGGTQGASLRPVVQLLGYLTALSFVPLAISASSVRGALHRILHLYATSVVLVSFVGIYQIISQKTGLPFMPIYRINGFTGASFTFGGEVINRVYSLAGEPKTLGVFLTPFVIMGIGLSLEGRRRHPVWWNRRSVVALVAFVDIMTFSTAVLLAIGISAAISVFWSLHGRTRLLGVLVVASGFSLAALLTESNDRSLDTNEYSVTDVIYARTFDRLSNEAGERHEAEALRKITIDHPENLLSGFGLGMYAYVLNLFYGSGIEPIDSGWITVLMDLGAIGVVLLIILVIYSTISMFHALGHRSRTVSALLRGVAGGLLASCALNLGTGALVPIMIWLGITLGAKGFFAGSRLF